MNEGEIILPNPEEEGNEPSVDDIANACAGVLGDEIREDFSTLVVDEAWGYAFTILHDAGQDPYEFFLSRGFIIPEQPS